MPADIYYRRIWGGSFGREKLPSEGCSSPRSYPTITAGESHLERSWKEPNPCSARRERSLEKQGSSIQAAEEVL